MVHNNAGLVFVVAVVVVVCLFVLRGCFACFGLRVQ